MGLQVLSSSQQQQATLFEHCVIGPIEPHQVYYWLESGLCIIGGYFTSTLGLFLCVKR